MGIPMQAIVEHEGKEYGRRTNREIFVRPIDLHKLLGPFERAWKKVQKEDFLSAKVVAQLETA